jgi:hypothetical protein
VHRQWDPSAYSREFVGLLIETNERMSMLISHLIIGYEGFNLISEYLCKGQCQITSRIKFLKNSEKHLNEKSFFSFLKSLSLFSCFYGIYPGELTSMYLLTYNLIYLYISVLIISEEKKLIKLMNIFGLNPIVYWSSRFALDLILSNLYSLILYSINSFNDENESNETKLTFKQMINSNNILIKNKFYFFSFILSFTTLPFLYVITRKLFSQ